MTTETHRARARPFLHWTALVIIATSWGAPALAQPSTSTTAASSPPPTSQPPPPPPPSTANTERPPQTGHTARLGFDLGAGVIVGDSRGASFILNFQLGYQASRLFSIYWQPGLAIDGWTKGESDASVFAFTSQLGAIDFTLGRVLQLGLAGGADIGRFGYCTDIASSDPQCDTGGREVHPAAEGRVSLIIPLPGLRARWGIPLHFRYHATFLDGSRIHAVTASIGLLRY